MRRAAWVFFLLLLLLFLFSPPYYDTILIYRNFLKYGRKAQRNHEAYTTWDFHAKLLRINLILIERQRQRNNNTKEKDIKKKEDKGQS